MHTYDELLAVFDQAEVTGLLANSTNQDVGVVVIEADDDPHRLARMNLEQYATRTDGRTLAFWQDEWFVWKKNAYRKISRDELRAKLSCSVKKEFDRLNLEQQAVSDDTHDNKGPAPSRKVSLALISNVMQATSGMVCIGAGVEPNTWLPTKERRDYTSMANGILDIEAVLEDRDDYLQPNTPQWFSFVSLPYAFDPEATCPRWESILRHNLADDRKLLDIAQEWAGYLLLPTTDEQKFMILEGEGKNGKSVFIAGLTAMLGVDNVSTVPLELFGDKFQLATSIGKLLNAAGDCGDLDKAAEGTLKSFTAGDRMYFDRKGISAICCTPTARLMIACNNLPRLSDRTEGIWRRMLMIPWRVWITEDEQIKGLDKVEWWNKSNELPGIFLWALRGLARLRRQGGFSESETMREAIEEHKNDANPTRFFLQQNIEENASGLVQTSEIYRIYKKWMEENGYRSLSERPFGKEVKRIFRKSDRIRQGTRADRYWAYEGIQFSQEEVCGIKIGDLKLF